MSDDLDHLRDEIRAAEQSGQSDRAGALVDQLYEIEMERKREAWARERDEAEPASEQPASEPDIDSRLESAIKQGRQAFDRKQKWLDDVARFVKAMPDPVERVALETPSGKSVFADELKNGQVMADGQLTSSPP